MRLLVAAIVLALTIPAQAQEYDSKPFVKSLIDLKSISVTCDPFVAGSPAAQAAPIDAFFEALGQTVPNVLDSETQNSLSRFVKQQAAALCRDMLNEAFDVYAEHVVVYDVQKGEGWPETPIVQNGVWCASDDCSEVR